MIFDVNSIKTGVIGFVIGGLFCSVFGGIAVHQFTAAYYKGEISKIETAYAKARVDQVSLLQHTENKLDIAIQKIQNINIEKQRKINEDNTKYRAFIRTNGLRDKGTTFNYPSKNSVATFGDCQGTSSKGFPEKANTEAGVTETSNQDSLSQDSLSTDVGYKRQVISWETSEFLLSLMHEADLVVEQYESCRSYVNTIKDTINNAEMPNRESPE